MSAQIPVGRQIAWISIIPHLAVMALIVAGFYLTGSKEYFLNGVITYIILSICLRLFVPRFHRVGIHHVKRKDFSTAIISFEKSFSFFSKYEWVDKYRFLALLSSSALSYRDMALCNIAFCYSQIGEGAKAMSYYKKALQQNPENGLAIAALNMMKAAGSPEN
jgi:tetratricopeptide (TPR) repeat protein